MPVSVALASGPTRDFGNMTLVSGSLRFTRMLPGCSRGRRRRLSAKWAFRHAKSMRNGDISENLTLEIARG